MFRLFTLERGFINHYDSMDRLHLLIRKAVKGDSAIFVLDDDNRLVEAMIRKDHDMFGGIFITGHSEGCVFCRSDSGYEVCEMKLCERHFAMYNSNVLSSVSDVPNDITKPEAKIETDEFTFVIGNHDEPLIGSVKWLKEFLKDSKIKFSYRDTHNDKYRSPVLQLVNDGHGVHVLAWRERGKTVTVTGDSLCYLFKVHLQKNAREVMERLGKKCKELMEAKIKEDNDVKCEINLEEK